MNKILTFIKNNWLVFVLLLVIGLLLARNTGVSTMMTSSTKSYGMPTSIGGQRMMDYGGDDGSSGIAYEDIAPSLNITNEPNTVTETVQRIVVLDTTMSMLVSDVPKSITEIEKITSGANGFMVSKNVSKPEGAANGEIVIRVPSEKREPVLTDIRALGMKVTNENVYGNDVTDQYEDIDTKIQSLSSAKSKMEKIMDQATNAQDLMNIQNQINNIQRQIDALKGRQNYLSQTAKLTKISIFLSTDELSLPYSPEESWRPSVVLKLAVRSMIQTSRAIASMVIWLAVYLPIVLLVIALVWIVKIVIKKNTRS